MLNLHGVAAAKMVEVIDEVVEVTSNAALLVACLHGPDLSGRTGVKAPAELEYR